jgi:aspartate/methionine/tyrosine aminotransferase
MKESDRISQVEEYYFSLKLKELAWRNAQGENVLNLGVGSPDLPPHPEVIRVLNEAAQNPNNHGYQSYRGLPELREAFANWYNSNFQVVLNPENEILPLMGSKEGIMHISMAFLNAGDVVLIPNPGYPTYGAASKIAGADVVSYNFSATHPGLPRLEEIPEDTLHRTKIMWVNYPHMPSGKTGSKKIFNSLLEFAKKYDILICHDNPYNGLLTDEKHSLLQAEDARERCLELTSLSKFYNMAGWRIGCLAGSKSNLNTVLKFKSNMDSGMFKPIQLAAIKALELEETWGADLNRVYRERKDLAIEIFKALGCEVEGPQAGLFVWARIPNYSSGSDDFSEEILNECGVFITPGHIFGSEGDRYLRLSLCSKMEVLEEALERIKNSETL